MIDTYGTRYSIEKLAVDLWVFQGWQDFLKHLKLNTFDSFLGLSGEVVDRNRRSVVYRLVLGEGQRIFYLKIHRNYFKKNLRTLYKTVPVIQTELTNLMHYARAGFDVLEPVACGWHPVKGGGDSFLLVEDLQGYRSLQEWLADAEIETHGFHGKISEALASMLAKMHTYGLAHVDLFSWHVFLKKDQGKFKAIPIDLERTKIKGNWPFWSQLRIDRKQANDLAALHLTVPWPQVSMRQRLRFFLNYCRLMNGQCGNKRQLRKVLSIAGLRGQHKKFEKFGVAALNREK